jgi:hypothetical protein
LFTNNKINCNILLLFKYLSEQRANRVKQKEEKKVGEREGGTKL